MIFVVQSLSNSRDKNVDSNLLMKVFAFDLHMDNFRILKITVRLVLIITNNSKIKNTYNALMTNVI